MQPRRRVSVNERSSPVGADSCGYSVRDPKFPKTAVGLSEGFVRECFENAGLAIIVVHYGSWSGRNALNFYQEIVLSV